MGEDDPRERAQHMQRESLGKCVYFTCQRTEKEAKMVGRVVSRGGEGSRGRITMCLLGQGQDFVSKAGL